MNNNHNQEPPPQHGPPPMVRPNGQAPRTMEELCQPSINGRGRPIATIPIQATDFGLQNGVSDDALRLSLFPYSLTHHAIAWYDRFPRNSIHSFDDMMRKFLSKYFPPSIVTKLRNEITKFEQKPYESLFEAWERYKLSIDRCPNHNMLLVTQIDTFYNGLTLSHRDTINAAAGETFMQKTPEECYELIENMTAHRNHYDTSTIQDETSRNISSTSTAKSPEVVRQLEMMNKNFSEMMRQFQTVKVVDTKCKTCGGPHSFTKCLAVSGYTQETAYATMGNYNSGGTGSLPSNTVPNPQEYLKFITTRSGVTLAGPLIFPSSSSKEVDREPEMITDQVLIGSTNNVPPLVVQPSPASTSFSTISSSKMPEVTKDMAMDFGLCHHMIQQVQNSCQFHGLPGDDANRHIDIFLEITQYMKQNGVSDDALRLSLFLYSLTHHATAWYGRLSRNSIHTFDDMMRKFLWKYFPPSMVSILRNEITDFRKN
uniref:Retrotransposon gag domain-containing protein n=1 Tax=Tanacetum cinerariifolium TaxID=118510 RepID=A0A699IXI5_TANCI|nr:hypothetical protein [Tanacetum cinerariifolium]